MCGICGIYTANNLTASELQVFQRALLLNVFRGQHSTGIIRMSEAKENWRINTQKSMLPSPNYLFSEAGKKIVTNLSDTDKPTPKGFIGHCRHATKGKLTIENAHPFGFDRVVGVHNGTITHAFKGSDLYDTDSEALYKLINDVGIEEALNEVANSDPAYVLVWVDKKEGTLNFIKNSKRPLSFTYLFNRSTLAWSSEARDLEHAVKGKGLSMSSWIGSRGEMFSLETNQLLTIPLGESPAKAELQTLDVKTPLVHSYYSAGYSRYYDEDWWKEQDEKKEKKKGKEKVAYTKHPEGADLAYLPWLEDPSKVKQPKPINEGEPETEQERDFRLSCGCFSCGTKVDPMDTAELNRVRWWGREYYACGDCFENVSGDTDWVWRSILDDWETDTPPSVAVH